MIPGPWKINVIPPTAISTDVGPPLRLSPVFSKVIIPGGKVPSEHYRQTGLAIQDQICSLTYHDSWLWLKTVPETVPIGNLK